MRHLQFLRNLEQLRFSGQLVQTAPNGQTWTLYLSQGRILYATGGRHPVRRWRRNLITFCPRIPTYRLAWQSDLANVEGALPLGSWEYALLNLWVGQQTLSREQAAQFTRATIAEVLFDGLHEGQINSQVEQDSLWSNPLPAIGVEEAIATAEQIWQRWCDARLSSYSPNLAPIIRQAEGLRKSNSMQTYQILMRLLNGENTLRDLAIEMKRDVTAVATSLAPSVQLGWLELQDVADLPAPIYRRFSAQRQTVERPALPAIAASPSALIACLDDSPLVRNTLEELLTSAGYQFMGLDDPMRAIGTLLVRKPDFIFLDLVMPQVNGYEVCEQLRKLSCFRRTPIVILTGSDGYANRLKSSFVGASGFLSKPLNAEAVLSTIRKHLGAVEVSYMG